MEAVKGCTGCRKVLPLNQYHKNKRARLGVTSRCKKCTSRQQSEWRKRNPEKVRLQRIKDSKRRGYNPRPKRFKSDTHKECATCGNILPRKMFYKTESYERIHCSSCYSIYKRGLRKRKIKSKKESINPYVYKGEDYKRCATCGDIHIRPEFYKMGEYESVHCKSCYRKKAKKYRQNAKAKRNGTL